jgi:hypothetical protein
MPSIVIISHGFRDEKTTAMGTYVVPPHMTIYFFTRDAELLNAPASDYIMDLLCTEHPKEAAAQGFAQEVKQEWEILPNYGVRGGDEFRNPTGVYLVGLPPEKGLIRPILPKVKTTLADLVSGIRKDLGIASRVYWLACREACGPMRGALSEEFTRDKSLPSGEGIPWLNGSLGTRGARPVFLPEYSAHQQRFRTRVSALRKIKQRGHF